MKSFLAVCVVAIIAILADAQSTKEAPPAPAIATKPATPPLPTPSKNPHGCDCDETCKYLQHSQVPYKDKDFHNYLSYESYPVLCRDASATYLGSPKKKYICKQTFDCCRKCNQMFYDCLTGETFGACMRAAYKCMCYCVDHKSYKELPYKKEE